MASMWTVASPAQPATCRRVTVTSWATLPRRLGDHTYSPDFELGGEHWQLKVYPGGVSETAPCDAGVYLYYRGEAPRGAATAALRPRRRRAVVAT